MSCKKPSCGGGSGSSEINTEWCDDASAGCSTCVPETSCEGHGSSTLIKNFDATVKVANSWIVPNCGGSAVLSIVCLSQILVGSYLWNPNYGYFKVVSYNSVTNKVTVQNDCIVGNTIPGTPVIAGSLFVISDSPFPLSEACTELTVALSLAIGTTTYTLTVGDTSAFALYDVLQIAGRTDYLFQVSAVTSSTQVQVFVYPAITLNEVLPLASTVCLFTPCINYEYRDAVATGVVTNLGTATINYGSSVFTSSAQTVVIRNFSQCRPMFALWVATGYITGKGYNALTYPFNLTVELLLSVDLGAYTSVASMIHTLAYTLDAGLNDEQMISFNGIEIDIQPQDERQLDFKLRATYFNANPASTSSFDMTGMIVKVSTVGVNSDLS